MMNGKLEMEWDLSNSIMCRVVESARAISATIIASQGGKPKMQQPLDFTKMNPYRH